MKENVIKEKNVKIPLYVTVYETISEWLKEGKYKPGDKLPGENILAEQLNVSRGTLRQAMLLLQEDGFIVNQQGRGNIVLSAQRPAKAGLEKIENPLVEYTSGKEEAAPITYKETEHRRLPAGHTEAPGGIEASGFQHCGCDQYYILQR